MEGAAPTKFLFDTFISYATEDEKFARRIAEKLIFYGFKTWFAPFNLELGDTILESINTGLKLSRTGILLISQHYIRKKWTTYELDVLQRHHIEEDKRLYSIWHKVNKAQVGSWNPGLTGILALNTKLEFETLIHLLVKQLSKNAATRGIAPCWECPYWRFTQGRGELNLNTQNGGTFHLFEALEFPDKDFPMYINGTRYTKDDLMFLAASALAGQNPETMLCVGLQYDRLKALCQKHGHDPDKLPPNSPD